MGCVVSLGVMRPTKNAPEAGMDRGLFAVLFEVEQGNICVRGAAGIIKEWRMVFAGAD